MTILKPPPRSISAINQEWEYALNDICIFPSAQGEGSISLLPLSACKSVPFSPLHCLFLCLPMSHCLPLIAFSFRHTSVSSNSGIHFRSQIPFLMAPNQIVFCQRLAWLLSEGRAMLDFRCVTHPLLGMQRGVDWLYLFISVTRVPKGTHFHLFPLLFGKIGLWLKVPKVDSRHGCGICFLDLFPGYH